MVVICKVTVVALFSMLETNRSCGNICCFEQNCRPGEITLQDSVLIIKFWLLYLLDNGWLDIYLLVENSN